MPFAITHPAVTDIRITSTHYVYREPWVGQIHAKRAWIWIDNYCLMVCIQHQLLYQCTVDEMMLPPRICVKNISGGTGCLAGNFHKWIDVHWHPGKGHLML